MKKLFVILSVSLLQFSAFGQVKNWESQINQNLQDFKNCMNTGDKSSCQTFTAKAINSMYAFNDFTNAATKESMTPAEISDFLASSSRWSKLGQAYQPEVITKAQELSNSGKAVLVVFKGDDPGDTHISILLPGDLHTSGSWGMQVPAVAAYFTHNPANSFVNKSLSYAYTKGMMLKLEVYGRK